MTQPASYITFGELSAVSVAPPGFVDGPTIFVLGGIHGNEQAGVISPGVIVRHLVQAETLSCRVVVVADAHPEAIAFGLRSSSHAVDLNRCFDPNQEVHETQRKSYQDEVCDPQSTRGRAIAIHKLVAELRPSLVITLHAIMDAVCPGIYFQDSHLRLQNFVDDPLPLGETWWAEERRIPGTIENWCASQGIPAMALEAGGKASLERQMAFHLTATMAMIDRVGRGMHLPPA